MTEVGERRAMWPWRLNGLLFYHSCFIPPQTCSGPCKTNSSIGTSSYSHSSLGFQTWENLHSSSLILPTVYRPLQFHVLPFPMVITGQSSQTAATTRIGQEAHEASGLSLARDPSQLWEGSKQHVHRVTCFIKFVKVRYLNHNQLKLLSLSTPTSSLSHFPPGQWPWGGHRCVLDSTRGKSNWRHIKLEFSGAYLCGSQSSPCKVRSLLVTAE